MLSPKKVKHRKVFKGRSKGMAYRGSSISFGDYAIKATCCGFLRVGQKEWHIADLPYLLATMRLRQLAVVS